MDGLCLEFFPDFSIFLRRSVGQIIYREYIVFRGSNIFCSLATAQSVIHYSPFTLHSPSSITHRLLCTVRHPLLTVHTAESGPSSITHRSHCTVRHPLLTVHTSQSVIHYSPFTLHGPSSITHHSHCTVRHPLLTVHSADSITRYLLCTVQTSLFIVHLSRSRLHHSFFSPCQLQTTSFFYTLFTLQTVIQYSPFTHTLRSQP